MKIPDKMFNVKIRCKPFRSQLVVILNDQSISEIIHQHLI